MDRNLLIATVLILLAAAFVGANFVYLPKVDQVRKLEGALKQEEELGNLLSDVVSSDKKLQAYDLRLMEKGKEEAELIDRVRKIANEVSVRVVSMTPATSGRKEDQQSLRFVSLRILFEGSYHQLGKFVAMVENSEKFMRIESLRFTAARGNASKPIVFEIQIGTLRHL